MNASVASLSSGSGPPSYPGSLSAHSDTDLPSYSPPITNLRRPRSAPQSRHEVEHRYELLAGNGRAWATLKIQSRSRSAQQMPLFVEGDRVNGSLALNLKKAENIKTITLIMQGQVVSAPSVAWKFLECSKMLWERSTSNEKLQGQVEWPFSLEIPKEIMLEDPEDPGPFRLPQTLLEKTSQASVQYDILVVMKRSGLYASTSRIRTMMVYIPLTRPTIASPLRRLAYQERSPLLGPDADPEGWNLLPPCTIKGKVFASRQVDMKCELYLATPLCYSRGTTIPCMLTISCTDVQALALVNHSRISLRLRRYVTAFDRDGGTYNYTSGTAQPLSLASRRHHESTRRWTDAVEDIATAVWWPFREGDVEAGVRRFEGEVKLSQGLKPSCRVGSYRIKYTLVFFPFSQTGFAYDGNMNTPLLEQDVEIATTLAPGPRPISYSPHSQDSDPRTMGGDNTLIPSVGLL